MWRSEGLDGSPSPLQLTHSHPLSHPPSPLFHTHALKNTRMHMHSHIRHPLPHSLTHFLHHSPTLLLSISPSLTSLRSSPPSVLYHPPSLPSLRPTVPQSVSPPLLFTQSLSRSPLELPLYFLPLAFSPPPPPLLLPPFPSSYPHMQMHTCTRLLSASPVPLPPSLSLPISIPVALPPLRAGTKGGEVRRTDGRSDEGDGARQRRDRGRG